MLVIVPNHVSEAIYAAIDAKGFDLPAEDREYIYGALLSEFDKTGCVPEFTIGEPQAVAD